MLTRLYLNDEQLGHGDNLADALEMAIDEGVVISPLTVHLLFSGCDKLRDSAGLWKIEQEPALTAETVRAQIGGGELFKDAASLVMAPAVNPVMASVITNAFDGMFKESTESLASVTVIDDSIEHDTKEEK